MNINRTNVVYFSPTGNTKKTVMAIASGIGIDTLEIDLTKLASREEKHVFSEDEIVIIGCPVYGGRIPSIENGIFRGIKGNNTLAVLAVNYGNREYEDALLELKNILKGQGFIPIAAGAFIGEHSYSRNIATSRPDGDDVKKMKQFGIEIKKKIESNDDFNEINVSGNYPYKEGMGVMPFAPSASDKCTNCGRCINLCPVEAIDKNDPKITDKNKCIKCFACIKGCPLNAKSINAAPFNEKVKMIEGICTARRKEIEIFI